MKYLFAIITVALLVSSCSEPAQPLQRPSVSSSVQTSTPTDTTTMPIVSVVNPVSFAWVRNPPANSSQDGIVVLRNDDDILRKNYYIVIDGSGSMGDSACGSSDIKMNIAKKSIVAFVRTIPSTSNVGMAAFVGGSPLEYISLNHGPRQELIGAIERISPGGGTPLHNAGRLGYIKLLEQGVAQRTLGEYNLIIVTDGEANDGQDPTKLVEYIVGNSPVTIHTVGFCLNEGHSLNRPNMLNYHNATDEQSLLSAFNSVLAEASDFSVTDFEE